MLADYKRIEWYTKIWAAKLQTWTSILASTITANNNKKIKNKILGIKILPFAVTEYKCRLGENDKSVNIKHQCLWVYKKKIIKICNK